ncbi:MAG: Ribosomal RNA small subunit methyltransferase G [uncultured bacterium]|nr:MAG: Ribosomal RNA small subunit methyltransferase G [uncultured bacterium]
MSDTFNLSEFTNQLLEGATLNQIEINATFCAKLYKYIHLLIEWNSKFNITSHSSVSDFIYKDILDQLIAFNKIPTYLSKTTHLMDAGAGAGFSGVILALYYTSIEISFLEKSRKKMNFIRHACLDLGIKANFINSSLNLTQDSSIPLFDMIISRATWDIPLFRSYVQNYVQNNGYAIYFGGPHQFYQEKQLNQNLEFKDELQYTILPYNYYRKLFIFQKNNSFT